MSFALTLLLTTSVTPVTVADMSSGLDLKVERVRSRIKAVDLAREMGVSRQRVSAIEALAEVPGDAADRYRTALMSLTSGPKEAVA